MSQVSRLPLSKGLETQMYSLFRKVLADFRTEKDVEDFLEDLLTPTEKIMLGKRFAIAFLLDQGYTQRAIHSIMRVSVTTVSAVSFWLHHKGVGYRKVIDKIRAEQKMNDFIGQIDEHLRGLLSRKTMPEIMSMPDEEYKKDQFRL